MISNIELINNSKLEFSIPNVWIREKIKIDRLDDYRLHENIKEVHLDIHDSRVEYIIKLARYSRKDAVSYLLQNSHEHGSFRTSPSYELLKDIWICDSLSSFESEDLAALLLVFADAADDISRINGPVSICESNVFQACGWVAEEIVALLPEELRIKVVSDAILEGKASSWVIYFVLQMCKGVIVKVRNSENVVKRLPQDEFRRYVKLAKSRLSEILNDGFHYTSNPFYLFEFWWQASSLTEKDEIREWVRKNLETDMDFLCFVDAFYEKKVFIEGIRITEIKWKIQIRKLENFISLDNVKSRLNEIASKRGSAGDVARELLKRIEYAESYEHEVKAGLHKRWSYSGL